MKRTIVAIIALLAVVGAVLYLTHHDPKIGECKYDDAQARYITYEGDGRWLIIDRADSRVSDTFIREAQVLDSSRAPDGKYCVRYARPGHVEVGNTENRPVWSVWDSELLDRVVARSSPRGERRVVTLDAAISGNDLTVELQGNGTSTNVILRVVNKTKDIWTLSVEEGATLTPSDGGVQSMVVTTEKRIELDHHEEKDAELEVACLDITKAAPAPSTTAWSVHPSPRLKEFIDCARTTIDRAVVDDSGLHGKESSMLQAAVWQARGATTQQWVEFFVKYHDLSRDDAQQRAKQLEDFAASLVRACPSILTAKD
jgi:hypothetical protein